MTGSDDFIRRRGAYTAAGAGCGGRSRRDSDGVILVALFLECGLVLLQCCGQCGCCGGLDVGDHLFGDVLVELWRCCCRCRVGDLFDHT